MNHTNTQIDIRVYFEKGMTRTSWATLADRQYVAGLTGFTMKQVEVDPPARCRSTKTHSLIAVIAFITSTLPSGSSSATSPLILDAIAMRPPTFDSPSRNGFTSRPSQVSLPDKEYVNLALALQKIGDSEEQNLIG